MSEHRKRKCAAKIEIARLALQGKLFHPLSTRVYSSRFHAWRKVSHGNRAERIIIRIHKFAFFPRAFARNVHARSSLPHRKNRLLRRLHFLHNNARVHSRVVISIPCILFLFFSPSVFLLPILSILQFHGVSMLPFVLVIRNIN